MNDEEYKYLDRKKFNLCLTRSKDLFIFMGDYDFFFNLAIENSGEGAEFLIEKFFRNSDYSIHKIVKE